MIDAALVITGAVVGCAIMAGGFYAGYRCGRMDRLRGQTVITKGKRELTI